MSLTQHEHATAMPGSSPAGTLRSYRFLRPAELLEQSHELPVEVLRQLQDPRWLAAIAELFVVDRRPDSRALLLRYLRTPLNAPGHEIFIRKLLRHAEFHADDQVLGLLLVALDRTIRRRICLAGSDKSAVADLSENALLDVADGTGDKMVLKTPAGTILPRLTGVTPVTDAFVVTIDSGKADGSRGNSPQLLFSVTTRRYLQRRLWRYFRKLGEQFPDRYAESVFLLLQEYRDSDTPEGLSLLDCHGLMHCLFGESPVVLATKAGWKLRRGCRLAELSAAPMFPEIWRQAPHRLWQLARFKNCRVVRQWASQLLQCEHPDTPAQAQLPEIAELLALDDPDSCRLAVALLENDRRWLQLTAGQWETLLSAIPENRAAAVTSLIRNALDSAETLPEIRRAILCSPWPEQTAAALQSIVRHSQNVMETALELLQLAAPAPAFRTSVITQWVWSILETCEPPAADRLLPLLENPQSCVRSIAMGWLQGQTLLWPSWLLVLLRLLPDAPPGLRTSSAAFLSSTFLFGLSPQLPQLPPWPIRQFQSFGLLLPHRLTSIFAASSASGAVACPHSVSCRMCLLREILLSSVTRALASGPAAIPLFKPSISTWSAGLRASLAFSCSSNSAFALSTPHRYRCLQQP